MASKPIGCKGCRLLQSTLLFKEMSSPRYDLKFLFSVDLLKCTKVELNYYIVESTHNKEVGISRSLRSCSKKAYLWYFLSYLLEP